MINSVRIKLDDPFTHEQRTIPQFVFCNNTTDCKSIYFFGQSLCGKTKLVPVHRVSV